MKVRICSRVGCLITAVVKRWTASRVPTSFGEDDGTFSISSYSMASIDIHYTLLQTVHMKY